jgi:RNA-directed DNA polymerase
MYTDLKPMDEWNTIGWKKIQRNVFKLQKRIYQAEKSALSSRKNNRR